MTEGNGQGVGQELELNGRGVGQRILKPQLTRARLSRLQYGNSGGNNMSRSERAVLNEITKYLDGLDNCFFYKTHGGRFESLKGQPDLSGVLNGYRFDIEVKAPGKDLRPIQEAVIRKFKKAGGIAGVARCKEDAEELLEPALGERMNNDNK